MAEKWEPLAQELDAASDWVTARWLSNRLQVTTRTIRNHTAQANREGLLIESGPAGYRLNRAAWNARVGRGANTLPRARLTRILRALIDAPDGLDLHDTAAANHVSESTLEADLAKVRARLDSTGLSLHRTGSHLTVHGPETARRRLLSTLFREESTRGMVEIDQLRTMLPNIAEFRAALITGLTDAGYSPNELALDDVLLHTAIAIERATADHPLEELTEVANDDIQALLERLIAAHFDTSVGHADLAQLARLLTTRAATRTTATAPSSPRATLVRRIVQDASEAYLVNLDDQNFIDRLTLHIDNLIARAKNGALSRNPLTAQIKAGYPLIYELAVYIAAELARTENITINDDEIAYIAMHVGAYLDRRRTRGEPVRVAVTAPAYHDVHTQLLARIRDAVDEDVELTTADVADLHIGLIVPAGHVDRFLRLPPFPSDDDLDRVRAEIALIRAARRRTRLIASLSRYISPELFVRGLRGLNREQVIELLGDRMIQAGVIDRAYVNETLKREHLSSTAFAEHLAVPHAMTMSATRIAIAVAIDEVPVDWDGKAVNVVAFIAFSTSGRAEFQDLFDQFVGTFSERENVQRLVHGAHNHPGLLNELAQLMEPSIKI